MFGMSLIKVFSGLYINISWVLVDGDYATKGKLEIV